MTVTATGAAAATATATATETGAATTATVIATVTGARIPLAHEFAEYVVLDSSIALTLLTRHAWSSSMSHAANMSS